MAKVWYVSPYFYERELAQIRHEYLGDLVDFFVWGEADVTTQGNENTNYFPEELKTEKVVNLRVGKQSSTPRKHRDIVFRLFAEHAVQLCSDKDIVVLADADELLSRAALLHAIVKCKTYMTLAQYDFCYDILHLRVGGKWRCAKVFCASFLRGLLTRGVNLHSFRHSYYDNLVPGGGWHLTNFGGAAMVELKHKNFGHAHENRLSYDEGMKTMRTPARHKLVVVDPACYFPASILKSHQAAWLRGNYSGGVKNDR